MTDGRREQRFHDRQHRVVVLGLCIGMVALLRAIDTFFWSKGVMPAPGWQRVVAGAQVTWLAALPMVLVGIACWLAPRTAPRRRGDAPISETVVFRVVSRGLNADALADTVNACREVMAARPLFPYRVEVVTDVPVDLPVGDDVVPIVVPDGYATEGLSKFKARALHYAVQVSSAPDDAWVVFLDEESHPTAGLIGGLRDFIADARGNPSPPVGQGCILYYRHLRRRPFLTLADMVRTGDDVTRFFAQYRMRRAMFGMHGSFIVVRNDVCRWTGFDVGPEGSITEDAWWALSLLNRGYQFAWVDGYLVEQAPESVRDFVKQRRRWFSGLVKVCLYAPAPAYARVGMTCFLTMWAVATLSVPWTLLNFVLGLRTATAVAWLGTLCFGWYISLYLLGLSLNLRYAPDAPGRLHRMFLYVMCGLLVPVFCVLEAAGVAYALLRPEKGFTVIHKSPRQPDPAGALWPSPAVTPGFVAGPGLGTALGH